MTQTIRILRTSEADRDVPLPRYATPGAAGADLCANLPPGLRDAGIAIAPGARALIPTGLIVELPPGYEWQIRARSGLALKRGLALANGVGTVDADYRGEVGVILVNLGAQAVTVHHGDRVAQAVLAPVVQAGFEEVDALSQSVRGAGGFGSTGVEGG